MTVTPFPLRPLDVQPVVDAMACCKTQKPARATLRSGLRVREKELRALGVDQDAIAQDALAFVRTVRAQLSARRRIAGAAEQIENKIQTRIGERAAAAALSPSMPKAPPVAPHLRVRFPNKVALHPTWWRHAGRDVASRADQAVREEYAEVGELIIRQSGNAVRRYLERLYLDPETIERHARGFEARVRAEVWRRVLLDHDPTRKANDAHDRG